MNNPSERPRIDRIVLDVEGMFARSKNRSYRDGVFHMLTTLARFLDKHNLTRTTIAPNDEQSIVPLDFTLRESDLAADGIELVNAKEFYAWLEGHDRGVRTDNVKKLEMGLERIRKNDSA